MSEWTGMTINDAARVAEDRVQWRGLLRAANPSYAQYTPPTPTGRNCRVESGRRCVLGFMEDGTGPPPPPLLLLYKHGMTAMYQVSFCSHFRPIRGGWVPGPPLATLMSARNDVGTAGCDKAAICNGEVGQRDWSGPAVLIKLVESFIRVVRPVDRCKSLRDLITGPRSMAAETETAPRPASSGDPMRMLSLPCVRRMTGAAWCFSMVRGVDDLALY